MRGLLSVCLIGLVRGGNLCRVFCQILIGLTGGGEFVEGLLLSFSWEYERRKIV